MTIEGIPKEVDDFNEWYYTESIGRKIKLFKTLMAFNRDDTRRMIGRNGLDFDGFNEFITGKYDRTNVIPEIYLKAINKYIIENVDNLIEVIAKEKESLKNVEESI